jgi:hypothetical protein
MQIWNEERPCGQMDRGKVIGKMHMAEFMSFEVYEMGGGDTGAGKKL